jgi:hypothetical protein
MPSQKDYLDGESQLVPNSLRVYRHFLVSTHTEGMRSVSTRGLRRSYQPRSNPVLTAMNHKSSEYSDMEPGGVAKATCRRSGQYAWWYQGDQTTKMPPVGHQDIPNVHCTCGFYAHYHQATDFYEDTAWTWAPDLRYDEIDYMLADHGSVGFVEPHIMVRAVVEVTGTVVMGSRGVRAEKMKIVAFAIDWDKYLSIREVMLQEEPIEISTFADRDPVYLPNRRVETRFVRGEPTTQVRATSEKAVIEVAEEVGAKFYRSVSDMYAEHPEPDLSGLGIEPAPSPVELESPWSGWQSPSPFVSHLNRMRSSFQAQQVTYAATQKAIADLQQALKGILDATEAATAPAPPRAKPRGMPDRVWQALEAKRNKPAPPGSGIDRRKKKP